MEQTIKYEKELEESSSRKSLLEITVHWKWKSKDHFNTIMKEKMQKYDLCSSWKSNLESSASLDERALKMFFETYEGDSLKNLLTDGIGTIDFTVQRDKTFFTPTNIS